MARSSPFGALACLAASVLVAFIPVGLYNEGALVVALGLVAVGVLLGVAMVMRRRWLGLVPLGLGLVLAVYYMALYGHRN